MRLVLSRYLAVWLTVGAALFITSGVLVLGTSFLSARDEEERKDVLPPPWERQPPPKVARPDQRFSTTVNAAKQSLSRNADLGAVLKAAESGDVSSLLALAQTGNYCAQTLREPPPECKDTDDVPAVYQEIATGPTLRPVETMASWIGQLLAEQPVKLEFASRDSRYGEGDGGRYYLVFRVSKAVDFSGRGGLRDGLGMVVKPGQPRPIQWFTFFGPENNGLSWVQVLGAEDGAKYQILIAPQSVKDWPGMWGEKGD